MLGGFTWSGGLNCPLKSRLDHFVVSKDWGGLSTDAVQCILLKLVLDNFPLFLDGGGLRRSPPFKFENMWKGLCCT